MKARHEVTLATREQVTRFIEAFDIFHGYAPSIEDVRKGCGFASQSTALYWLRKLRAEGRIDYEDGKARTLRVL